ncbi:MAG: DUF3501 family protein [Acidimicrobiales bacterium]
MADKLSLHDIADLRAYERERDEFRTHVIALKRRRRVHVGPVVTLVFENRDTIRFQIQEMARAERMLTDAAIQGELDAYNPLIPGSGELSATLFIELTTEGELREWLPKLVGIERSVELRIGESAEPVVVRAEPESAHAAQLTRDEITASVHYIRWSLRPDQIEVAAAGPLVLAIAHPEYRHQTRLGVDTAQELLTDLRGGH